MENSNIKTLTATKCSRFYIQGIGTLAEARFKHSQSAKQEVQTLQLNDSYGSIGILNAMLKRFAKERPFSLNFTRTDIKGILAFLSENNGEVSIKRKEYEDEENNKLVSWAVKYSNKITEPEEVVEHEVESFFDPNAEQERPEKVLKQFLREMR